MSTETIPGQTSIIDTSTPPSSGIASNPFIKADRAALTAAASVPSSIPLIDSTERLPDEESNSPFPALASIYPTQPNDPENISFTGITPPDTFEKTDPKYWLDEMVFKQTSNIGIDQTNDPDIKSAGKHISAALADIKPFIDYQKYYDLLFSGQPSFTLKVEAAEAIAKIYNNIKQKKTLPGPKPVVTYESVPESIVTEAIQNINKTSNDNNNIRLFKGDPVKIAIDFHTLLENVSKFWLADGISITTETGNLSRNLTGLRSELETFPLFLVGIREPSAGFRLSGISTSSYIPVFQLPNGTFRDPTSTTSLYPKEIILEGKNKTPFISFTDSIISTPGKDTRVSQTLGNKSKRAVKSFSKNTKRVIGSLSKNMTRKLGNLGSKMSQRFNDWRTKGATPVSGFVTSSQAPPFSRTGGKTRKRKSYYR